MDGNGASSADGDGFQFFRPQDGSAASPPCGTSLIVNDAGVKNLFLPGLTNAGYASLLVAKLLNNPILDFEGILAPKM